MTRVYGLIMCLSILGGLACEVFVNFTEPNIYFLLSGILTAWLISDALERHTRVSTILIWSAAALILAPIVVSRWYATRPLRTGELRKGGIDANFFNAFGVLTVIFTGASAAVNFMHYGSNHGFELIINAGFSVAGTGLVLALASKQHSVTEVGRPLAVEPIPTETPDE